MSSGYECQSYWGIGELRNISADKALGSQATCRRSQLFALPRDTIACERLALAAEVSGRVGGGVRSDVVRENCHKERIKGDES